MHISIKLLNNWLNKIRHFQPWWRFLVLPGDRGLTTMRTVPGRWRKWVAGPVRACPFSSGSRSLCNWLFFLVCHCPTPVSARLVPRLSGVSLRTGKHLCPATNSCCVFCHRHWPAEAAATDGIIRIFPAKQVKNGYNKNVNQYNIIVSSVRLQYFTLFTAENIIFLSRSGWNCVFKDFSNVCNRFLRGNFPFAAAAVLSCPDFQFHSAPAVYPSLIPMRHITDPAGLSGWCRITELRGIRILFRPSSGPGGRIPLQLPDSGSRINFGFSIYLKYCSK